MQRVTSYRQQKINEYRACSPIRSPMKSPMRGVSPLRNLPYGRQQAPMSPIRVRKFQRSVTPTKGRANHRVQLAKSPHNALEKLDTNLMERTIKNGIGLFQQLANQHKIGSEKKENKLASQNTTPFEYSQKKKEFFGNYPKNSFTALIQNVREIQSIQASKGQYASNQISFKTIERSKQTELPLASQLNLKRKNTEPIVSILQSFGSPKPSQVIQNPKQPKKAIKNFEIKPQYEFSSQKKIQDQPVEPENKIKSQMITSFEDVLLLLRKASQKQKEETLLVDDEVRVSFSQDKDGLSFNMNPFL